MRETYSNGKDSSQIFKLKTHLWGMNEGEKKFMEMLTL